MSVNNIGNINPDNNIRRNQQTQSDNNANTQHENTQQTQRRTPVNAYRQYLVNNNYNITSSLANDNDAEMTQIYELDKEAFGDFSSYSSAEDFKDFIRRNHMSVYAVKDGNNQVIGYYNLEPIKDGDLYIDSIGLKPEYRNSKKGYCAIRHAWDNILNYAKENQAQTLSLHADSSDTKQVKLYEHLGFQKKEDLPNYWGTGQNAYFMEFDLTNAATPETNSAPEISTPSGDNKYGITFSKANDNDAEMREIYEMDNEAFAQQDPHDSFQEFMNELTTNRTSVYSVKDKDGALVGYFAVDPVKDKDMYIYSVASKPEYRNTREGYDVIKRSWENIQNQAKEQGAESLSLHVDAENDKLIKLYKRFGFEQKGMIANYYANGHNACFMCCPLKPNNDVAPTEDANQETVEDTPQQPEISREQQLKQEYKTRCNQIKKDLTNLGITDTGMQSIFIDKCSYDDKQTESKIFSEELYPLAKEVYNLVNDQDDWHTKDSFQKVMSCLTYTENGIPHAQRELLPKAAEMKRAGLRLYDFDDIFRVAKVHDKNGKLRVDPEILDKAITLGRYVPDYSVDDTLKLFKLEDKDKTQSFSSKAFNRYLSWAGKDKYGKDEVFKISKYYDKDGKEYFDDELCKEIYEHINRDDYYKNKTGLTGFYHLSDIRLGKCRAKDYMKYAETVMEDEDIKSANNKYNKPEDVGMKNSSSSISTNIINAASVIRACTYECGTEEKTDYETGKTYRLPKTNFDRVAFNTIKDCLKQEPMPFDNLKNLADVVESCKIKPSSYENEKFSPELFAKALKLKETGIDDEYISGIMNACKIKTEYYTPQKFCDEAFNAVIEYQNGREYKRHFNPNIIKCSIAMHDDKEYFDKNTFDYLKNHFIEADYDGGTQDFVSTYYYGHNRSFDLDLYKKYYENAHSSVRAISEEDYDEKTGERILRPNPDMINAYAELKSRNIEYKFQSGSSKDIPAQLLWACKNNYGLGTGKFVPEAYNHLIELLDQGYNGNQAENLIYACKEYVKNPETGEHDNIFRPERYAYAMEMMKQGVSIENACDFARRQDGTTIKDGVMTNDNTEKLLELNKMGVEKPNAAYNQCFDEVDDEQVFNPIAYERLKEAVKKGFPADIINNCKDDGVFKDRLFKMALDLQKKDYDTVTISALMGLCHDKYEQKGYSQKGEKFNQNVFNHIADMETLGIDKNSMPDILTVCRYDYRKRFEEKAFEKVSELKNKGYEDNGIVKLIDLTLDNKTWKDDGSTDEKYNALVKETAKRKDLKAAGQNDAYVIEKIHNHLSDIKKVRENFGEEVLNYAISYKTDNYINFVKQGKNLLEKTSEPFLEDLKKRLDELPSPELKAKRLGVLGGLAGQVDESALKILTNMIKSPKMSDSQVDLANEIFSPEYISEEVENSDLSKNEKDEIIKTEYEKRVNRFVDEINTPKQFRQTLYDYLMKERLDKSINRPKSIEEQKAQMEKNAQQMLTNAKIPLDKKITYIEEYKAKIKDMEINPDKYLVQTIFPKPLNGLKKVVEAYVNIPNDDKKFNNSITEAMYTQFGIETTPDLLSDIHYDAKYFDKLFSSKNDFRTNFKRLIELKKMTLEQPLTESRITLPEENTEQYEKYSRLGLIEQIKANLDTVRQFKEHNLRFDRWNSFNPDLNGETFSVEADPETEYRNIRYNLINIFQDDFWNVIKQEERDKLQAKLQEAGFTIFNNELYKNGKKAENSDIEKFTEKAMKYVEANGYWHVDDPLTIEVVAAEDIGTERDNRSNNDPYNRRGSELVGISAFFDHLKGFHNRLQEVKNARTVNDIHFRLTDENNIGRNIFFGNHVGCCNSVESTHAGYSAPMHLLNNYNRGLELVDNWGNSYGNSLCYFADVDGKLTFVIDSFEANGKLASNPIVTDKMIDYAKTVCKEMGREDAQIMIGPNYNHIDMSKLKVSGNHTIKVIGTVSERTYCDSVGGRVKDEINKPVENRSMHIYQA